MVDSERLDKRLKRLERRRSAAPLQLSAPGPDAETLRRLLTIAMRVPDHGKLEPWRFIVLEGDARIEVARQLAATYIVENPNEDANKRDKQITKIAAIWAAAPVVVIVVSRANSEAKKPEWEQILSAGAVCMNLLTAATLAGFDGVWLTGWAAYNEAAKRILGVVPHERIAGIIHLGTENEKQKDRPRPDYDALVTRWRSQ
ncbi:nitroreductase [Pseudochelatococcus sp. G4_1912]|uniref:nitroreductase family protein n=1 Tax=Pseudochelatococcus sp. G4_1912 TaxID=3114288 RepID=UPI0039C5AB32